MAVTVRCPICKKDVAFDNPYMPFCSDRCRIIDLGNWAAEKYVISTPTQQNETEEFEESEPPEGSR
ncbi:MAG: DNA gyrase inhibitor YacG [Bryobacteraceae bacterium]